MRRNWTPEEEQYLEDKAGKISLSAIAKKLNRTIRACEVKLSRLGISVLDYYEYLTTVKISNLLGINRRTIQGWIKNEGLKYQKLTITAERECYYVTLEDLMEWLKDNQDKWNSKNFEPYALGSEPQWLKNKRLADIQRKPVNWSDYEDGQLTTMFKLGLNSKQISIHIGRTPEAVRNKIGRLGLTRDYIEKVG